MKTILFLSILLLLSGCASVTSRLEEYKSKNMNTAQIEIQCDIKASKQIVKEAIKEVNLVERQNLEKENFIFANTGYGTYLKTSLLSPRFLRVGFFFEPNQINKTTTIIISEEGLGQLMANNAPIRYNLIDKIKLKSLDYNKLSKSE